MNRTILTTAAGIVAASAVLTGTAAASNYKKAVPSVNSHVFCSKASSEANMLVANNNTTAIRYAVKPGQCHYGDWVYVSTGTDAVAANFTWGPGWHYQAGYSGTSLRIVRK